MQPVLKENSSGKYNTSLVSSIQDSYAKGRVEQVARHQWDRRCGFTSSPGSQMFADYGIVFDCDYKCSLEISPKSVRIIKSNRTEFKKKKKSYICAKCWIEKLRKETLFSVFLISLPSGYKIMVE